LARLFAEYTHDFAFTKTRVVVKLFTIGTRFISRSEARRVLCNLEKFRSVVLDFTGVEEIGQGFADEVFRVWQASHPDIKLQAVSMSAPVAFLVRWAQSARSQPTRVRSSLSPGGGDRILCDQWIGREQGQSANDGLTDQHAIERILV